MKFLENFEDYISKWRKREKVTRQRFEKSMIDMTEEETLNYVLENCKDFINYPIKMCRGLTFDDDNPIRLFDYFYSKPVKRWARDNMNWYNLIMDQDPSWKGYPKRQKSFMCSLDIHRVGNVYYYIIPKDNSKWGIAPRDDIFQSFKKSTEEYTGFAIDIDNFFNYLNHEYATITGKDLSDTDYYKLQREIENFQNLIKSPSFPPKFENKSLIRTFLVNNKDNLWDAITAMMNPEKNDFKLLTWKNLYEEIEKKSIITYLHQECWTQSPCVFIRPEIFEKFIAKLSEKVGKEIKLDL